MSTSSIMHRMTSFAEGSKYVIHVTSYGCVPYGTEAGTCDGCHDISNLEALLSRELEMEIDATVNTITGEYCVCSDDMCN